MAQQQRGDGSPGGPAGTGEPPDPNDFISPLDRSLGLHIAHADEHRVDAAIDIDDRHWQAHGIVHGGVYCTVIETVASIGASYQAGLGQQVVGISNRTTFIRAISRGRVTVAAALVERADDLQLWKVDLAGEDSRLIATGQVQLMRLSERPPAVSPRA